MLCDSDNCSDGGGVEVGVMCDKGELGVGDVLRDRKGQKRRRIDVTCGWRDR